MISAKYLQECLIFDACNGAFTWRQRPVAHFKDGAKSAKHQAAIWNARFAGAPAFATPGNHGYLTSTLSGKRLLAHRVAWAIYYGNWPIGEIDHVNGIKTDNRIDNLRDVPRAINAKNLSVRSGASRGVYWYDRTARWVAKIQHKGRQRHLGYYANKEDALRARAAAEIAHGFHTNHGRAF